MSWVYLLKFKSEAFENFRNFKALVEKQSGCNIKILRTDRGGEFLSNDFNLFCEENGICRELTTPYTPQQNGVAERKNRTVVEMARSLLNARGLPVHFWGEAVATAVYLLNISPTKAVLDQTPYEAWMGRKPRVHLKVFGCIAYALVNLRSKLDEKSEKCIFIGYSPQSKAYRLYNPTNGKVIINRNVVFNEEAAWEWMTRRKIHQSIFHFTQKRSIWIYLNQEVRILPLLVAIILISLLMEVPKILLQQALILQLQHHPAKRQQSSDR